MRRQDLPIYHRLNGAIYLSNTESFLDNKTIYHGKVLCYKTDNIRSVDNDNEFKFKMCEILINNNCKNKKSI